MKSVLSILCIILLVVSCNSKKGKRIQDAFSWVPQDATQVLFDDWAQIRSDFKFNALSYWKGEWIPGGKQGNKDNFLPYANGVFESSKDTLESRSLGFILPEIEWQLVLGSSGVKKMSDYYDAKVFHQYCRERHYTKINWQEKQIFENANTTLYHAMLKYLYYDERNKVLVHSGDLAEMKKIILAKSGESGIGKDENIHSMLDELDGVESVYFTIQHQMNPALMVTGQFSNEEVLQRFVKDFGQVFLGLNQVEEDQLSCPSYWCIAEKKDGQVINVLLYDESQKAQADAELRAKILKQGVSLKSKQPLSDSFTDVHSKAIDNHVVLQWKIPANWLMLTHIANLDTPWNVCPF